jgi:hypothetical protein
MADADGATLFSEFERMEQQLNKQKKGMVVGKIKNKKK